MVGMKVSVTAVPLTVATTSVSPEIEEGACDELDPDGEDGPTDEDEPAKEDEPAEEDGPAEEDDPVEEAESAEEDEWEFQGAGADPILEGAVGLGDVLTWVLLPDCDCDGKVIDD